MDDFCDTLIPLKNPNQKLDANDYLPALADYIAICVRDYAPHVWIRFLRKYERGANARLNEVTRHLLARAVLEFQK